MKREDVIYDGQHSYRLTRDVENPDGDKRQKHDWRKMKVWEKGITFVARVEVENFPANFFKEGEPAKRSEVPVIQRSHVRFPGLYRIRPDKLPDAFFDALEPEKISLRERFEALGWEHWYSPVFEKLIDMGKITIEDVYAAIKRTSEEP